MLLRCVVALFVLWTSIACRAGQPAEFFPLMAWDSPPNDPAVLKRMSECGITVAGFVPLSALDACHAAGMKAIVSDTRINAYDWHSVDANVSRTKVAEVIAEVRDHPAVFGYYLRDEPSAGMFPGLAAMSGIIKELHPGVWPYINLFPNYADTGQLGAPSYDAYLEQFVATCQPPIVSYDHYALLEGGALRESYFANLEAVRNISRKHKLPFWNIILAASHFNYREVTAADFRFQAYTSLAYGARGIAYFKYFTPAHGNFRLGPIDQFGNETRTWQAMQHVNMQVAKLAPTLLQLTSDSVYHFGAIPAGCNGPASESLVATIGGPMMVGDFTHQDGSRYVLVVNKDFDRSYPCGPQFRAPVTKLEHVSPYSGALVPFTGEYVWLAPGQGVLLKLTP